MILNIRGTHGSGKSTVVKALIDQYPHTVLGPEKKPEGYAVSIPWLSKPLMVVGSYRTACGGCDSIQPYSLIWPRVEEYSRKGHVVFEGALVSSSYGNIGRSSEVFGSRMVFAFLDTPLKECLNRIKQRRMARGDDRPLDPKNTKVKYDNILRSIPKICDELGRTVVMIKYNAALAQVKGILLKGDK